MRKKIKPKGRMGRNTKFRFKFLSLGQKITPEGVEIPNHQNPL